MINAMVLCDQPGIPFTVDRPRAQFLHGWGDTCERAKPIRCSWSLTVMDANDWPVTLTLDLVEGISQLIVGMDIFSFISSDTYNRTWTHSINFKRPHDVRVFVLYTYIADDESGNRRIRLQIVPHSRTSVQKLLADTHTRRELNMAKRIHRFGHETADEMKRLLWRTTIDKRKVSDAYETVYNACPICASTG